MPLVSLTNIKCAQDLYAARLCALYVAVEAVVTGGMQSSSEDREIEILALLDVLEKEIDEVGDCVNVLAYLSRQARSI